MPSTRRRRRCGGEVSNELVALGSSVMNFWGNRRASRLARLVELDSSTYIPAADS